MSAEGQLRRKNATTNPAVYFSLRLQRACPSVLRVSVQDVSEPGQGGGDEGDKEMTDRRKWKAELILNGPKGFASAEVEVPITPWGVDAAAAQVNNIYQEMPEPHLEKLKEMGII